MRVRSILAILLLLFIIACDDDDVDRIFDPDVDLDGTWSLTADTVDPPETGACSDDLSGMTNVALCAAITLELQQNGGVFSGDSPRIRCGREWSVTGTVNRNDLEGELVGDDGDSVWRITFTGVVDDNRAEIEPEQLTIDDLDGSCTVAGIYNARR